MNVHIVFTSVVVIMAAIQSTDAFWGFRRLLRKGCDIFCPRLCPQHIIGNCKFSCSNVCGRSKRTAIEPDSHLTPLPRSFQFYDLNEDGGVDRSEFARTMGQNSTDAGLRAAFTYTDSDGDGKLTREELMSSKVLVFESDDEI